MESPELVERLSRMVDGGQSAHPAEDLLADDQVCRLRLGILDADRLIAGLIDRLLEFRSEGHGHLPVLILSAGFARKEVHRGSGRGRRLQEAHNEYRRLS